MTLWQVVVVPTVVGLTHRRTVEQASLSSGNTQSRRDLTIETTGGHEMICAQLTALPEPSGTQSSSRFSRWYFSAALTQPTSPATVRPSDHPQHQAPTQSITSIQLCPCMRQPISNAPRESFRPVALMHHHRSLLLQAFVHIRPVFLPSRRNHQLLLKLGLRVLQILSIKFSRVNKFHNLRNELQLLKICMRGLR